MSENKSASTLRHIAFIMDGNGRWAKKRHMMREYGHKAGAQTFRRVVEHCHDIGINVVTVYAFSTENWKRPQNEIDAIMSLFDEYLDFAVGNMMEKNVRIIFLGDKGIFPEQLRRRMINIETESAKNEYTLNIGINYGGRDEILHAVNACIREGKSELTAEDISAHLYTHLSPEPDLIVRTGDEYRLSNFLMWQSAYSELYFSPVLWPDFSNEDVDRAVAEFNRRSRRFGGI